MNLHHPDDRLVLPFMIQALLVNADGKIVVNPAFVFCVEDARMFFLLSSLPLYIS